MKTAFEVTAQADPVTLYHGTTKAAAQSILTEGWKSSDARSVADRIAKLYNIDADELYNHSWFEFSRGRTQRGDTKLYFATDRQIAASYAGQGPEMIFDALMTVFRIQHGDGDDNSWKYEDATHWAKETGSSLDEPVILSIEVSLQQVADTKEFSSLEMLEKYGLDGTVTFTPEQLQGIPVKVEQ